MHISCIYAFTVLFLFTLRQSFGYVEVEHLFDFTWQDHYTNVSNSIVLKIMESSKFLAHLLSRSVSNGCDFKALVENLSEEFLSAVITNSGIFHFQAPPTRIHRRWPMWNILTGFSICTSNSVWRPTKAGNHDNSEVLPQCHVFHEIMYFTNHFDRWPSSYHRGSEAPLNQLLHTSQIRQCNMGCPNENVRLIKPRIHVKTVPGRQEYFVRWISIKLWNACGQYLGHEL